MPHLGAFVPSNYFAFIYVPVYSWVLTTVVVEDLGTTTWHFSVTLGIIWHRFLLDI